eukprot:2682148-Pyramimonas_sp.AAC.2
MDAHDSTCGSPNAATESIGEDPNSTFSFMVMGDVTPMQCRSASSSVYPSHGGNIIPPVPGKGQAEEVRPSTCRTCAPGSARCAITEKSALLPHKCASVDTHAI